VRERMRERGVDVLFVTSPPNLCYLTGFESVWYPPRAPVGVVVRAEDERLVFLDYERHETLVRETAHCDDAVFYRYEDVLDTIAATFRDRRWLDGAIGLERWSQAPGAPLVAALAARLGELGGRVVDGDWIVDRVRLVKSPAEIACVRRAAAIVDAAFADLVEHVRPGQTELQIAARLDSVMADHGGEGAAIRTMVSAGPGVWCRTHAPPSRRPVEVGDVMYVDACGVYAQSAFDNGCRGIFRSLGGRKIECGLFGADRRGNVCRKSVALARDKSGIWISFRRFVQANIDCFVRLKAAAGDRDDLTWRVIRFVRGDTCG